jgi:hypothetical protein
VQSPEQVGKRSGRITPCTLRTRAIFFPDGVARFPHRPDPIMVARITVRPGRIGLVGERQVNEINGAGGGYRSFAGVPLECGHVRVV